MKPLTKDKQLRRGEKKNKSVTKGGVSDTTMQNWWRNAVRKRDGNKCVVTGQIRELQCHHHLRERGHLLTRNDMRNGILVGMDAHPFMVDGREQWMTPHYWVEHTPQGKQFAKDYILEKIGEKEYAELEILAGYSLAKNYFFVHGITRKEYLLAQLKSLKEFVG